MTSMMLDWGNSKARERRTKPKKREQDTKLAESGVENEIVHVTKQDDDEKQGQAYVKI